MAQSEARSSILTRILLGFLLVIAGFGGVAAYSAYKHHQSVERLRLVNQGYLRLTLRIGFIESTQAHFGPFLDRLLEESNPEVSLQWLRVAYRLRPTAIRQAREQMEAVRKAGIPDEEVDFVARTERSLAQFQAQIDASERRFTVLEAHLTARNLDRARRIATDLRATESQITRRMRLFGWNVRMRITELSDRAARDEQRTLLAILFLAAMALAVGVLVTILSHKLLSPLRRLQEGAEAVARGDLSQRMRLERTDEIGSLAKEFDGMIDALQARDEQLRRQSEDLVRSERLAAIGKMAAHITHEVRNPLSSIGLNAELLEEEIASLGGVEATKEARSLLGAIAREVDRLTALTQDYLRLARVPSPAVERTDLGALVRSVVEFLSGELREARVEVRTDIAPGLDGVPLDEGQIRQVLVNLLRNGREAMAGGGNLTIEVARREDDAEVAVTDTGPGVPPEEKERVFEPFHTTKEAGTGLGLSLAAQLVRGHGGNLRLESPPEGGARFVMTLPLSPPETAGVVEEERAEGHA